MYDTPAPTHRAVCVGRAGLMVINDSASVSVFMLTRSNTVANLGNYGGRKNRAAGGTTGNACHNRQPCSVVSAVLFSPVQHLAGESHGHIRYLHRLIALSAGSSPQLFSDLACLRVRALQSCGIVKGPPFAHRMKAHGECDGLATPVYKLFHGFGLCIVVHGVIIHATDSIRLRIGQHFQDFIHRRFVNP